MRTATVFGWGKFEFEMIIKATQPKEDAAPAKEEASEEAEAIRNPDTGSIDFDVSDWLQEADAVETARRQSEPDTRQFQLDETDRIRLEQGEEEPTGEADEDESEQTPPEKKEPGKLPERPSTQAATSRDAAADMLKKFFNNR